MSKGKTVRVKKEGGESCARGGKAQAFLPLSGLCLIGFINSDPGIMRPLLVGIFLKAVGPDTPQRRRPAGPHARCAPPAAALVCMCVEYALSRASQALWLPCLVCV